MYNAVYQPIASSVQCKELPHRFSKFKRKVYDAFSLYEHTLLFQGKVIRNGVQLLLDLPLQCRSSGHFTDSNVSQSTESSEDRNSFT